MTLLHEFLDRAARSRPDSLAVGYADATLTYRELHAASRRIATWLHRQGVRRGDRVVLVVPTDLMVPALLYGCSRVGAVFSVLNPQSPEVAIAHVVEDCEPVLVLRDLDEVRRVAVHGDAEVVAGPIAVDPVCLVYTSGSTGMPKAVVSTHAQVVFAAQAIQSQLEYLPSDTVFCALPLSFDYGLYQVFLSTLAGSRLQLGNATDAGPQLIRHLRACGATVLPAVPAMAAGLARMLARPGTQPPALRLLTNTGAAMQAEVITELRHQILGLQVQLMFGLTECKRAAIMPKDEDLRRPGACGKALPGTEILVVDPDGTPVPAGEVGEIVVRGPNVMSGYWRRPELTAQRFPRDEGLFPKLRTGDYGRLDTEGYLYFVGRRDDIYKEHGSRVSVTEVEAAAHRVPGVVAAAVLPPLNGHHGATLFAVTTLTSEQVLALLRDQIEDTKAPRVCVVVDEIPLTPNGKVDRKRLSHV